MSKSVLSTFPLRSFMIAGLTLIIKYQKEKGKKQFHLGKNQNKIIDKMFSDKL